MFLKIHPGDATPVYAQVMQQMKYAIAAGAFKPGDRLPTVRELAAQLLINPNTVLKVYGELEHEGVVVSQKGRGIFVANHAQGRSVKDREKMLLERCRALVADGIYLDLALPRIQKMIEEEYRKLKEQNAQEKPPKEEK